MNFSDIPTKLPIPFANNAGGGYVRPIPTASQIGTVDGAASLHDGFVPLNATPIGAGGVPPDVRDMNGILYEISGWTRWQAAGGPVFFDGGFASAIGGYPKWAVVASAVTAGVFFVSAINANSDDPDAGSPNWTRLAPAAATGAEALARTDGTKFISPAVLGTLSAITAEVVAGSIGNKWIAPDAFYAARANAAAVLAGTDDHRYITPAALAGAGFFGDGTNWLRFGSKIVQWGHDNTVTNTPGILHDTNYNVPFGGVADAVVAWGWDTSGRSYNQKAFFRAGPGTTNGFPWKIMDDDSGDSGSYLYGFDWIAWGPA